MLIFHEAGSLEETAELHGIAFDDLNDLAERATNVDTNVDKMDRAEAQSELAFFGIEVIL